MKKGQEKKRKKRMIKPKIQTGFCIISILFILGCCIFYGNRLIKYYKVYNPKSETGEALANLSSTIINNSQIVYDGDGLYSDSGNYIYKGKDVNNYLIISNMLFRIIKVNSDRTVDVVLDDYINKLNWDSIIVDYKDSYIKEYLNSKFLDILDKNILEKTTTCTTLTPSLNEVDCENYQEDDYVRLLGITDFLNSLNEEQSYLVNDNDYLWLYNHTKSNVWNTKGTTISSSSPTNMYGIKPVVTLKNNIILISGDGSKENPYQIKSDGLEINVGTYLDINDDVYIVYEVGDDYYKIQSNRVLKDKLIFDETSNSYENSSLKKYLETTYIDSLSYKDLLVDAYFSGLKSEVGLLSMDDLKFNSELENYFLSTIKEDNVYLYNGSLVSSKVNVKRNVRPCIAINKNLEIVSGNGSKMAPFIIEV